MALEESVGDGTTSPESAASLLSAYDQVMREPAPPHWPKEDGGQN